MTPDILIPAYSPLVQFHLEYYVQTWSPSQLGDIRRIETLQLAATILISGERFNVLKLFSLEPRRDQLQVFEMVKALISMVRFYVHVSFCNAQLIEGTEQLTACF